MTIVEDIDRSIRLGWKPSFKGEIYDFARKLDLQRGYAVKGAFDIETARHLIAPLQAIRNPRIPEVVVVGAVQTLKSLIYDLSIPYWIENDPGDTLLLLEDDPKALLYADTRLMPLIQSVPEIAVLLESVDRNDKTKRQIQLRNMLLKVAGLNEGNVQSLSWRRVIIDEAWMHGSDGLVRQAKARTTQYIFNRKILIIGQGGVEGDDQDLEWKSSDQGVLHWACPHCGKFQPFEQSRQRPDDFAIEKLRGTYAGLTWEENETTRKESRWNLDAVGKTAHYRCYFCDGRIEDGIEERKKLSRSFTYFPQNASAQTGIAGFSWPAEASIYISFSMLVQEYLAAKTKDEERGYRLPLQEYYQKRRGIAWRDDIGSDVRQVVSEYYDPKAEWKDAKYRFLLVDCQRDLKKFFFSVREVSLTGESRELDRGQLDSFDAIAKKQIEWKVNDQHVFLDCGYEMTKVLRECVKHGHIAIMKGRKYWLCWTGLKGSGAELFIHRHQKTHQEEAKIYSERKWYDTNIGTALKNPRSPWYLWSNLHCKDILRRYRDGDDAPKFLSLPDTLPPNDLYSYYAQMHSEQRLTKFTRGRKVTVWELVKDSRPNHAWDICAMFIAVCAIIGIVGSSPSDLEDEEPIKESAL